ERMAGKRSLGWGKLQLVVRLQSALLIVDQLERVGGLRRREEHIFSGDQDGRASRSSERIRRPDLRQHIAASIRWRWAFVFLGPVLGQWVGDSKISIAVYIVDDASALGNRSYGIAGARPCTLHQDDPCRHFCGDLWVVGKVSAISRQLLRLGSL